LKDRVLISGAGITGLALGFWFRNFGVEAILVDRASRFEALGHYISLKGNGVEVIRQMGLEKACRARECRFSHHKMMRSDGALLRMGSQTEFDQNLGGYILMRRSDLHATLFDATKDFCDIRYGVQINAIRDDGERTEVKFSDGSADVFDLVIGADGIHSHTRKLTFGDGFEVPLGGKYIGLTDDYEHGLATEYCRTYWGIGKMAALFPTAPTRISAIFYCGDGGIELFGIHSQSIQRFLLDTYQGFAPEVIETIAAMSEHAFVFMDSIAQVRLPSITKGRVALVGDAAHCPTFMSGMGSSLALQGARLLAQHVSESNGNMAVALGKYESDITPIARRHRDSALQMRPLLLKRRASAARVRNWIFRLTPVWIMKRRIRSFFRAETLEQSKFLSLRPHATTKLTI
jgi:2-polyprenyl-6-methoxyphenol hydroxylase-like FAD-dependent oxidoreductase